MLRLLPVEQVASVWDCLLPPEIKTLPEDLARLDRILAEDSMLEPFRSHWEAAAHHVGRPSLPMAVYVRLMVVKHRTGWGYETLVREVSDSLHLRRFCLLALHHRAPHESTVRKLTRRLGAGLVDDRGFDVEEHAETLHRGGAPLGEVDHPADGDHRPGQPQQEEVEGDELAEREGVFDHQQAAVAEHGR